MGAKFCTVKTELILLGLAAAFLGVLLGISAGDRAAAEPVSVSAERVLPPEEKLWELLHCTPGSATILGLANDADHQVRLLMERGVYEAPFLSCHPCICTSSLKLKMSDVLAKLLPHTGHEVTVVDLPDE